MDWNFVLATCDAAASAVSLTFAIAAFRAIKQGRVAAHRLRMVVAVAASFVFLVLFVVRFATFGFAPAGKVSRLVLLAHEPVAVINIPLVLAALVLGLRRADAAHREVAPLAFWIWMFVLATGLVIYALQYFP